MNLQQKTFCYEYLKDFNAVKSYVRAKYSARSAPANASILLNTKEISDFITSLLQSEWDLSKDQWLYELRRIGKGASKASDKLRALELYGKSKNYLGADTQIKNFNVYSQAVDKLKDSKDNSVKPTVDISNNDELLSTAQACESIVS